MSAPPINWILALPKEARLQYQARLQASELCTASGELTELGIRMRDNKLTEADGQFFVAKFREWYPHSASAWACKSPIDCGDR